MAPSFGDTFWPTIWATFIGVALAIPAGLAVNRLTDWLLQRRQRERDEATRREVAVLLGDAITFDCRLLDDVARSVTSGQHMIYTPFDQSTWLATRAEIGRLVADAGLRSSLGRWFEDLRRVERMIDRHRELVAGVAAAIGGLEETRGSTEAVVKKRCDELVDRARALLADLKVLTE